MRVSVRLPRLDTHIPTDGKIPDGMGLPVLIDYDGARVGRVVGWDDHGDGTAMARLELEGWLPEGELELGLDGVVGRSEVDGEFVVDSIVRLKSVGVWAKGSRGPTAVARP